MKNSDIRTILDKASEFNLDGLRQFLTSDSVRPLIAVGSGGMREDIGRRESFVF